MTRGKSAGYVRLERKPVMTGRVVVLKAYGGDFELREYPVPDPEPGAVLVRLTRAGVCGSDLHIWRGQMKEIYGALPRNLTLGHIPAAQPAALPVRAARLPRLPAGPDQRGVPAGRLDAARRRRPALSRAALSMAD